MNETNQSDNLGQIVQKNIFLSLIATALIFAGVVGLFAPELVKSLLPPDIAKLLVENALLILLVGIGIEGYHLYQLVQSGMARAKKTNILSTMQASPGGDIPDDPIAQRTAWTPAASGGANFRTKRLIEQGPSRFEVRATSQLVLFCWLFIALGIVFGVGFAFSARPQSLSVEAIAPGLICLLFVSIGALMLYFSSRPAVFDRRVGWYWKGSPALRMHGEIKRLKQATALSNIHALQLISEHVRGNKSSYHSYELNLVLKDGRRINVMDHGNQNALVADADLLARFLGVPVWKKL